MKIQDIKIHHDVTSLKGHLVLKDTCFDSEVALIWKFHCFMLSDNWTNTACDGYSFCKYILPSNCR